LSFRQTADARTELDRLVDEYAALQRGAVLVAQAVQPAEIFASVSEEVGPLFDSDMAVVGRYDPDATSVRRRCGKGL
jgi:hypothetical protein